MTCEAYLHGCNYPWSTDGTTVYYGLDFGANVWGSHLGVSTRHDAVAHDFSQMAALGFTVARWFVFCDGRSGIEYDEAGVPTGLDPHFFRDFDAALEIASSTGIRVDIVLLDHHWMFSGLTQTLADPAAGLLYEARLPEGRARVLLSARGRDALLEHVFRPLVRRYGPRGPRADLGAAVLAYELMNEPDFVIAEWERDLSSRVSEPLPFLVLAELVARLSDLVHDEHPSALATLGCAKFHNLWAWDDDEMALDVLQVHAYPDVSSDDVDDNLLGAPASALGVRRPVILGEFPGNLATSKSPGETGVGPADDFLEFALRSGYVGAWPWSFSGTDRYGRVATEPLLRFAQKHPEIVNPRTSRNR